MQQNIHIRNLTTPAVLHLATEPNLGCQTRLCNGNHRTSYSTALASAAQVEKEENLQKQHIYENTVRNGTRVQPRSFSAGNRSCQKRSRKILMVCA